MDTLSKIKSDDELKNIPVIVASLVADKALGQSLGATDCLEKPFDWNELAKAIYSLRRTGN